MKWWRWYQAYQAHPDPLIATANFISIMVGTNQPFYPLYAWFVVGRDYWPSWSGVLSMPFFLAVPWLSRRSPMGARVLLLVAGSANVVLMCWALGEPSGLELFFMPCATIAALLFRRSERLAMLALVVLPLLVYLALRGHYPPPWHAFSDDQYANLRALNGASSGGFIAFIGILFANLLMGAEERK